MILACTACQSTLLRGKKHIKNDWFTRSSNHGIRDINIIAGFVLRQRDLSICAGLVCAGTGFSLIHRTHLCGNEIRIFHRTTGYGIRALEGFTGPRDYPESRTTPRDSYRGKESVESPLNIKRADSNVSPSLFKIEHEEVL